MAKTKKEKPKLKLPEITVIDLARQKLERKILGLLKRFEKKHNVSIEEVRLYRNFNTVWRGGSRINTVHIPLRLT